MTSENKAAENANVLKVVVVLSLSAVVMMGFFAKCMMRQMEHHSSRILSCLDSGRAWVTNEGCVSDRREGALELKRQFDSFMEQNK